MTSTTKRFTDDLALQTQAPCPPTVTALLARLGRLEAAPDERAAAVTGWLAHHTPSHALRADLERQGFVAAAPPVD